jgi:hypothetical protein
MVSVHSCGIHNRKPDNKLVLRKEAIVDSSSKKILSLFVIIVCDSMLTIYLVVEGWGEANPLMNWYMQMTSVTWMAITKIIGSFITLFLISKRKETERYLNWAIPLYICILMGGLMFQFIWESIN